ncbi:hypothetical protein [Pseudonocardia sp. MH-G8]|nr:hypothetical protein [Pseudonocardia sp. MH-G8]
MIQNAKSMTVVSISSAHPTMAAPAQQATLARYGAKRASTIQLPA